MTNHHTFTFQSNLQHIQLQGNRIAKVQNYYDEINSATVIILSTNTALPKYDALTPEFDYKTHLLLPSVNYQYIAAENRHRLLNRTTISFTICPSVYVKLKMMSFTTKCGFDLFFDLIVQLNPYIGGRSIQDS